MLVHHGWAGGYEAVQLRLVVPGMFTHVPTFKVLGPLLGDDFILAAIPVGNVHPSHSLSKCRHVIRISRPFLDW